MAKIKNEHPKPKSEGSSSIPNAGHQEVSPPVDDHDRPLVPSRQGWRRFFAEAKTKWLQLGTVAGVLVTVLTVYAMFFGVDTTWKTEVSVAAFDETGDEIKKNDTAFQDQRLEITIRNLDLVPSPSIQWTSSGKHDKEVSDTSLFYTPLETGPHKVTASIVDSNDVTHRIDLRFSCVPTLTVLP